MKAHIAKNQNTYVTKVAAEVQAIMKSTDHLVSIKKAAKIMADHISEKDTPEKLKWQEVFEMALTKKQYMDSIFCFENVDENTVRLVSYGGKKVA